MLICERSNIGAGSLVLNTKNENNSSRHGAIVSAPAEPPSTYLCARFCRVANTFSICIAVSERKNFYKVIECRMKMRFMACDAKVEDERVLQPRLGVLIRPSGVRMMYGLCGRCSASAETRAPADVSLSMRALSRRKEKSVGGKDGR